MTTWEAFLLGVVQGFTEFLPVSSSGHLALGQYFLGMGNLKDFVFFNLICHLGTLTAIFFVFFQPIKEALTTNTKIFFRVCLATLPLFPLVIFLKPIKALFEQPELLGPCFICTATLIFLSSFCRFPIKSSPSNRVWSDSITIGCFQAGAILPGISRSGATISAARLLGWGREEAIHFSFLLAIPAILGGVVLESYQVWKSPEQTADISLLAFVVSFIASFVFGCLSLHFLMRCFNSDKWKYFAWYCLALGIGTTLYFQLIG
jgi:undecaprenyl-diphosphatase